MYTKTNQTDRLVVFSYHMRPLLVRGGYVVRGNHLARGGGVGAENAAVLHLAGEEHGRATRRLDVHGLDPCGKRISLFECFPYVSPEPVLAK